MTNTQQEKLDNFEICSKKVTTQNIGKRFRAHKLMTEEEIKSSKNKTKQSTKTENKQKLDQVRQHMQ